MKLFYSIIFLLFIFSAESAPEHVRFLYDEDAFDFLPKKFGLTGAQVGGYQGVPQKEYDPKRAVYNHIALANLLAAPNDGSLGGDRNPKTVCLQEIVGKARLVMEEAAKENPSVILGLGRAPNFLIETINYFYGKNPNPSSPSVFSVAFSGSPDAMGRRDFRDPLDLDSGCIPPLHNVVTPKRKAIFFAYLDSLKLKEISGKIWCVDYLGAGSGLNSFLRLLREYYGDRMPQFRFWALNIPAKSLHHETWDYDFDRKILSFHSPADPRLEGGLKPMEVPTYALNMSTDLCYNLDTHALTDLYGSIPQWESWQMKATGLPGYVNPHSQGKYFDILIDKILTPGIKFLEAASMESRPLSRKERQELHAEFMSYIGICSQEKKALEVIRSLFLGSRLENPWA